MVLNWLFACWISGSLLLEGRNPYEFFNNVEIRLKGRKGVCYAHLFYKAATYLTEDVTLDLFRKQTQSQKGLRRKGRWHKRSARSVLAAYAWELTRETLSHGHGLKASNGLKRPNFKMPSVMVWFISYITAVLHLWETITHGIVAFTKSNRKAITSAYWFCGDRTSSVSWGLVSLIFVPSASSISS